MKVPRCDEAVVAPEKITDYLLAENHPLGRHKAAFFGRFGYSVETGRALAEALRRHAAAHDVAKREATPFGMRYTVEGPMATPDGRNPGVCGVCFVEAGTDIPRFVTAYPAPGRRR